MKKQRLFKLAALLVLCWSMFGCGKDNKLGSIYGTVTDFETGEPVCNANIRLNPCGETTLTGLDGTYEFKDLEKGNYSLSVSKSHYVDLDDDYVIEIENGNSVHRDLQLNPEVFGTISGEVVDFATGEPVEGALVTLSPTGMNVYTNSVGLFEFLDLDKRQYTVTVQKVGYFTSRKTVIIIPGSVISVIIALQANN